MKYNTWWRRNCICNNLHIIVPGILTTYFLLLVWGYYFEEEEIIELKQLNTLIEPDLSLVLEYKFTPQEILSQGRTTEAKLNTIRNFIKSLEQWPIPKVIQDETLILFLLSCENNEELTKRTIISHYENKKKAPEIFDNRSITNGDIQKALNTIHMSILPERTEQNEAIAFFRVNDSNYHNFDLVNIMKTSSMLIDIAQEKDPPSGLIILFDARGLGIKHLTKIRPGVLRKCSKYLQEGLPIRVTTIHILNTSKLVEILLDILKTFMDIGTLMKKLRLHRLDLSEAELFRIFPKKYWPKEYNGDLPSERDLHNKTVKLFYEMQHFWENEEKIRKQYY